MQLSDQLAGGSGVELAMLPVITSGWYLTDLSLQLVKNIPNIYSVFALVPNSVPHVLFVMNST